MPQNNKTEKAAVKGLIRPYRLRILLLCCLTLVQSVLLVGVALLTKYVIDAAISANGQLLRWSILLGADLLSLIAIHSIAAWLSGSTTDRFTASLRGKLLKSAVYSTSVRLQGFHSGQLLSRGMEDVTILCDGVVNALPSMVGQVARLVMSFVVVLILAPKVAGVLAIAGVAVILAVAVIRPKLKKHHKAVRLADEKVMATMQEDLQQLELIQALDVQENILHRFAKRLKKSLLQKKKRRILTVGISSVLSAVTQIGTGALLLWGAVQVYLGALTYGSLTAMLQLLSQFRGPVLSLSGLWTRFAAVDVAAERLSDLLTWEEGAPAVAVNDVTAVVFDHVTFTYPDDEAPVICDFTARFPLEKWACLTGISGKGKTTMFKLILGLYSPDSGHVWLETKDGKVPCSQATRHLFAYVPQDFALFSGTIMENLLLVTDDNDEKLRSALQTVQAEFVWGLSAGENTRIRENNTGLSKGQLQRLAIARALLMERPILLLDECTSALDAATESAVLKALHDLGKQAILVTHRPDALSDLDGVADVNMEA